MTNRTDVVRVLLADPHPLFRSAFRVALESMPDLRVVAAVGDGLAALAEAEDLRPDVALVRAGLPPCGEVTLTELITTHVPECRVVVLAETEDRDTLAAVLEAGGSGYLTDQSPLPELVDAVRSANRGEMLVPSRMLEHVFGRLVRRRHEDDVARRIARLTPREREVLGLLAEGAGNAIIAEALLISPQTARTHIQKVIKKLEVHSRLEAVLLVTRPGLPDDLRRDHGWSQRQVMAAATPTPTPTIPPPTPAITAATP
jgi:two-component system, NarL family, nitrate/nitrite response regulator NarL